MLELTQRRLSETTGADSRAVRFLLTVLLAFVMAVVLVLAAAPQVAWAAGEAQVSVEYRKVRLDDYLIVDNETTIDPRDEMSIDVDLGSDVGKDLVSTDGSESTPYVKGTFWLRPVAGGDDIKVMQRMRARQYGWDYIEMGNAVNDDGSLGNSVLSASFTLPSNLRNGSYKLVMSLQFKRSIWNTMSSNDGWSAAKTYVANSSFTVKNEGGGRPAVAKRDLKVGIEGKAYSETLTATPSVTGNSVEWADDSSLAGCGLALSKDGRITGKVANISYAQRLYFHVTATERDSSGKVVGSTTRAFDIYLDNQPGIEDQAVTFQRASAGIVPGSKASAHMHLSNDVAGESAKVIMSYTDAGGASRTQDTLIYQQFPGSRVYVGELDVPADAVSIQKVTFDAESVNADESKYVELEDDEQAVAPALEVKVRDAAGNVVTLDEQSASPSLKFVKDGEEKRLWLDVNGANAISDTTSYELEPGTYDVALCAYIDGVDQEFSDPASVTLDAGRTAELPKLNIGSFAYVRPSVTAGGKAVGREDGQIDVSYGVSWYADEACTQRIAGGTEYGWVNTKDVWVRAESTGRSLFDYATSDVVKVTAENAAALTLDIPERPTCTVKGSVAPSSDDFALSGLTATLSIDVDWRASRTWASSVADDGTFQFADVPVGFGADVSSLTVSGVQVNAVQKAIEMPASAAGGAADVGAIVVKPREGVVALRSPVNYADVYKADGTFVASTLSKDSLSIFLDDPSQVAKDDVLTCKLYKGSSNSLYGGGVEAYCEVKAAALNDAKRTVVESQDMQVLGKVDLAVSNSYQKTFGAVLALADSGIVVDVQDERQRMGGLGSSAEDVACTFGSVPPGTYRVLLADLDALNSLDAQNKLALSLIEQALDERGSSMWIQSDAFTVEEGAAASLSLDFPDSKPNAAPISTDDSSLLVAPFDSNLHYRATIAMGQAGIPEGEDLNLVIKTTQTGQETSERTSLIAGSVVYINGMAATAHATIGGEGSDGGGSVYLLPNSLRNSTSTNASNGVYVVSIPAADLASGKYGAFDAEHPLSITFSAPRMNGGKVFATGSVAFGNIGWSDHSIDTAAIYRYLWDATYYNIGECSYSNATVTCQTPGNVSATRFTVNGVAPAKADLEPDTGVDIYIDGAKVTSVTPNPGSGLYNATVTLSDPYEYSTHSVCAKVTLAGGDTKSSAVSTVLYSKRMAALERIEVSTYNGGWSTSWLNGQAVSGYWYYLPSKPTKYRLTFNADGKRAPKGSVTDVYVNVPHGTDVWRLKASCKGNGQWETEEYEMGNTPPSGEWVTFQPAVPDAVITKEDAAKIAKRIANYKADVDGFAEASSEERTLTYKGNLVLSLSKDGKTATFEDVNITTTSKSGASTWVGKLPKNPWASGVDDMTVKQKQDLEDAGYVPLWQLVDHYGNVLDEGDVSATPDEEGSNVEYKNVSASGAAVYQRVGLLDSSWDGQIHSTFEPTGADKGKVATDIVYKHAYEDGSGYLYDRVTATRGKMVHTICDTKLDKVYELVYKANVNVPDATSDLDGDGQVTIDDKVIAVNAGWSAYADDMEGLCQGILPEADSSPVTTQSLSVQSASDAEKGSSSALPLQVGSLMTQGWLWGDDKPVDYANASSDDTMAALAQFSIKYGGETTNFGMFCHEHFNPTGTNRGGVDQRARKQWGSEGVKQAIEAYAGYYEGFMFSGIYEAAGLTGWNVDIAADITGRAKGAAKGAYGNATGNNGKDATVKMLRREYYEAILAYNKEAAKRGWKPIPWDDFPLGSDLPDPRTTQPDPAKPKTLEDAEELYKKIMEEEGQKKMAESGDLPGADQDSKNRTKPNGAGRGSGKGGSGGGSGSGSVATSVANSNSHVGIIDPSGFVYTGVTDNRLADVTATLFEVNDDGSRVQWGAQDYGQVNPYMTDDEGHYEWFVPEGKWSVTFAKRGYLPYTTGADDGVGAELAGDTWYMPVAPAQLDVNVNLVKATPPQVQGVEWTKNGIEVTFTQVMNEESLSAAMRLSRNGEPLYDEPLYATIKLEGSEYGELEGTYVTRATISPEGDVSADDVFTLEVSSYAESDATTFKGMQRDGVKMVAGYVTALSPTDEALDGGALEQAKRAAQNLLTTVASATVGVAKSANGSDVATTAKWAPQSAFDRVSKAVAALNAVLENESATSSDVSSATIALQDALDAFSAACKNGTKRPAPKVVKGKTYAYGSGTAAAYYLVKSVATAKAAGSVWYVKPKTPAKVKTLVVPATIKLADGKSYKVTGVSASACAKCTNVTKATIGANVATIGANAFKGCKKLKTLVLGKSVASIGANAFSGCIALTKVTLGAKVKTVGASAFKGCKKLKTLSGGKAVTSIGANAFNGCVVLAKVALGAKVKTVGKQAFKGCKKLSKLTVGAAAKTIGANAFNGCKKLATVTVSSKSLTKASCKNLVKGTKITKVKLSGKGKGAKKAYKKYFPKKNAGKKLTVL